VTGLAPGGRFVTHCDMRDEPGVLPDDRPDRFGRGRRLVSLAFDRDSRLVQHVPLHGRRLEVTGAMGGGGRRLDMRPVIAGHGWAGNGGHLGGDVKRAQSLVPAMMTAGAGRRLPAGFSQPAQAGTIWYPAARMPRMMAGRAATVCERLPPPSCMITMAPGCRAASTRRVIIAAPGLR